MWQSSYYIPPSIPVLDHPLAGGTRLLSERVEKEDEDEVVDDPLGANDTPKPNNHTSASSDHKPSNNNNVINEGPLSNTLLENSNTNYNDSLDPQFIGFKPWSHYRTAIRAHFHGKDLSLETSFLKTSTKNVRKKR
jgi:hypothetical protein